MEQGTSTARAFSVMQELQQLRDKVGSLSEKNRHLAKALTATKQELTKARAAQTAVFSNKVVEWMEARCKPVEVRHQATQCGFEELYRGTREFVEDMHLEPEPPLSPRRIDRAVQKSSRMPSPLKTYANTVKQRTTIGRDVTQEREDSEDDDSSIGETVNHSADHESKPNSTATAAQDARSAQVAQYHAKLSPYVDARSNSQSGAPRRLRRRDASVSYVEPKLNTKLRRGDSYGLDKRTGQPGKSYHHRPPTHRVISEPRRATSAFVPAPFGQQPSPFRRRTSRPIQRVSYAEPKLNTKLRQGDKFTFTT
ncbi:calcium calmodulin dependent protein kinase 4 [Phytophthora cinnamomi]|uniref:calcium calmodulin dependent protein kinase 4 n=1 Tax=Phytophthora cinnamomi TaxID=4785 RepID=UPI00355A0F06|nr:calcium calmodulin dependent protein kinase 4 [Phytophthora cinnamomi]